MGISEIIDLSLKGVHTELEGRVLELQAAEFSLHPFGLTLLGLG